MKACDLDFLLFYDFPHILSQPNVALGLFFFFSRIVFTRLFAHSNTGRCMVIYRRFSFTFNVKCWVELGCINIMLFLFFVVVKDGIYI
jgi:hypothetical protein